MKYLLSIMLGILCISTVSSADGKLDQKEWQIAAEGTGTVAGAPAALRLKIVTKGFHLEWTLSPDDPGTVTGYEIVRSDRFSGPYDPVATVPGGIIQYIDTTALPEIIYFYKVRAIAGKGHSPFSNTVSGER